MKSKTIVTISGRISAGKSYVAKMLHKEFGFPIASFGGYLKYYCEQNGLPTDRKTLQDTGERFIKADPQKFLSDVLSHFVGQNDSIILEGVRHRSIFEAVKEFTANNISIFVDADLQTRYKRYFDRNKDSDEIKTFEQFIIADSHKVELEIESLKPLCDFSVDSTTDYWASLREEIKASL